MESRANTSVTITNDNGKVMFSPHEDNTDDSEITVTPESTLRGSGSDHGYLGDDDDESLEYKERDRLLIRQSTHSVEVKNVVGNGESNIVKLTIHHRRLSWVWLHF